MFLSSKQPIYLQGHLLRTCYLSCRSLPTLIPTYSVSAAITHQNAIKPECGSKSSTLLA